MYMKALNKIENGNLILNENFLKINKEILEEKLNFWKNNSTIQFDEEGHCEIKTHDNYLLNNILLDNIEKEIMLENDIVLSYLEKSILHFSNGNKDYIINGFTKINDIYHFICERLLDNPLITITYQKNKLVNKFFKVYKKEVAKKEVKLSKILTKMNDLMLEGEEEYLNLSSLKKKRIIRSEEFEEKCAKFKGNNPYWIQQKYLPYKTQSLIISINPLDIFTCSGSDSKFDTNIQPTNFSSCYETVLEYNEDNEIEVREEGQYSVPSWLYKYNSMLTKAIIFIPNQRKIEYKGNTLYGMLARSHMYLFDENKVFCEKSYPTDISFSTFLENVFSKTKFYNQYTLEQEHLSKNDYYVMCEYSEDVISLLSDEDNIYFDGIGLFQDLDRYCIYLEKGGYYQDNRNAPSDDCEGCFEKTLFKMIENNEEFKMPELHLCGLCEETHTCENCSEVSLDVCDVKGDYLCPDCKDTYYCSCIYCDDENLKEDCKELEDEDFVCDYCEHRYYCDHCYGYSKNVSEINGETICDNCKDTWYSECNCCLEKDLKTNLNEIEDGDYLCDHCK